MIAFDVFVNGTKRCRAGVDKGVLSVLLDHVVSKRAGPPEVSFSVGGLETHDDAGKNENVEWFTQLVAPGDEIRIVIVDAENCDPPTERRSQASSNTH